MEVEAVDRAGRWLPEYEVFDAADQALYDELRRCDAAPAAEAARAARQRGLVQQELEERGLAASLFHLVAEEAALEQDALLADGPEEEK